MSRTLGERATAQTGRLRVLVVDDHPLIRMGLAASLSGHADVAVCGEAADGSEAVARYLDLRPDVTLMDLRLPGMDGLTAIEKIRELDPAACVIVLTNFCTETDVERAFEAGARGYVLKDATPEELLGAIRDVHGGREAIGAAATARLAGLVGRAQLTSREFAVLQLLAGGPSNREIGEILGIAEATVKVHVTHLFEKLNVGSRTEALAAALHRGIVRP